MQPYNQECTQAQLESAKNKHPTRKTDLVAQSKSSKELPSYRLRYVVSMALLTTFNIGKLYINDYAPELGSDFMKYFKVTPKQVQLFCAIYSFPAVVTSLLAGPIITRFGATKVAAFGGFVIFLTTSGYYLSVVQKNFTMLLGFQICYGVIGEVFSVAQNICSRRSSMRMVRLSPLESLRV